MPIVIILSFVDNICLCIQYHPETTDKTVCSCTAHTYFNKAELNKYSMASSSSYYIIVLFAYWYSYLLKRKIIVVFHCL